MHNKDWRRALRIALLTLFAGCAATAGADLIKYDYTSGWPLACASAGSGLIFHVNFHAENRHENGVIILPVDEKNVDLAAVDADEPQNAPKTARFNGHYHRGAGGYWQEESGQYVAGPSDKRTCYLIFSRHKRVGPGVDEPWISSHFRIRNDNREVGFSDFADRRYINAVVKVSPN